MPKPAKNEEVNGRFFHWRLGQRNGVYFADGRANQPPLGRQTLGTRDRQEALQELIDLDLTMAVQFGRADASQLQTDSHQIVTWAEGRRLYENYVKRPLIAGGTRPATAKRYRAVLDKFIPFAEAQGRRTWNELNRQLLDDYASWLDGESYAYATEYLELTTLKQILKFLITNQSLPSTVALTYGPPDTDPRCPNAAGSPVPVTAGRTGLHRRPPAQFPPLFLFELR